MAIRDCLFPSLPDQRWAWEELAPGHQGRCEVKEIQGVCWKHSLNALHSASSLFSRVQWRRQASKWHGPDLCVTEPAWGSVGCDSGVLFLQVDSLTWWQTLGHGVTRQAAPTPGTSVPTTMGHDLTAYFLIFLLMSVAQPRSFHKCCCSHFVVPSIGLLKKGSMAC